MSPTRIVPNHSAQRASAVSGRIGAKRQMVNFGALAQAVQNDSRQDASNSRVGIELQNSIHVLGEIQHHGDVATLTGKARAGSARQDRRAILFARRYCGDHIIIISRNYQADGNLAIVGGIRGVKSATAAVETNFSVNVFLELFLQLRRRSKRIYGLGMGAKRQRGERFFQKCLGARGRRIHDETAGCIVAFALAFGSTGISSAVIQSASIAPNNSRAMLPTKGSSQFPVRSMIRPAKTGEMIA